jgi:hypothetical protein
MKRHTTNYFNTFIEVADDCPVTISEIPPTKGDSKTVANIQFEKINKNSYKCTSDDVLFQVFAEKNDLTESEFEKAREHFFSKGQPCFRASPLTKRYGWGVHNDEDGKIALFSMSSVDYHNFTKTSGLKVVKAMKSSR